MLVAAVVDVEGTVCGNVSGVVLVVWVVSVGELAAPVVVGVVQGVVLVAPEVVGVVQGVVLVDDAVVDVVVLRRSPPPRSLTMCARYVWRAALGYLESLLQQMDVVKGTA